MNNIGDRVSNLAHLIVLPHDRFPYPTPPPARRAFPPKTNPIPEQKKIQHTMNDATSAAALLPFTH